MLIMVAQAGSPTIAPMTGTVHYPIDDLIALAKLIIKDLRAYHISLRDAADDIDDEDTSVEEGYIISYIYSILIQVEPPPPPTSQEDVTEFERRWREDPRSPERDLLSIGSMGNSEWVIKEAVTRRRSTRGTPPADDSDWRKEDALLDFIQFLAKPNHAGLFSIID